MANDPPLLISNNDLHAAAAIGMNNMSPELDPMALITFESATSKAKFVKETTTCGLNLKEFFNADIWRVAIVELILSATATFLSISAVLACLQGDYSSPHLLIAVCHAAILCFCIMAGIPLSGGHVNPCITLICIVTRNTSPIRGIIYLLAQVLGGYLGSAFVKGIVAPEITTKYALAGCLLKSSTNSAGSSGMGILPGLLSEFCFTFILLFALFPITLDPQSFKQTGPILAPILIGLFVGLLIFISASFTGVKDYTGAIMNPARCFGPAIIEGKNLWHGHWIFWVGPFSACILVGVFYNAIPLNHADIYSMKLDVITQLKRKILNL